MPCPVPCIASQAAPAVARRCTRLPPAPAACAGTCPCLLLLTEVHGVCLCPPQGEHSFCLTANTSSQADVEAALAAMAPHAACPRLEMVWRSGGRPINLAPTKRLPSLPHVRRMEVTLDERSMARLSLPMPRLEELTLPATPEMFAPPVPRATAFIPASNGAVPFPALRRLSVTAIALIIDGSTGERRA